MGRLRLNCIVCRFAWALMKNTIVFTYLCTKVLRRWEVLTCGCPCRLQIVSQLKDQANSTLLCKLPRYCGRRAKWRHGTLTYVLLLGNKRHMGTVFQFHPARSHTLYTHLHPLPYQFTSFFPSSPIPVDVVLLHQQNFTDNMSVDQRCNITVFATKPKQRPIR